MDVAGNQISEGQKSAEADLVAIGGLSILRRTTKQIVSEIDSAITNRENLNIAFCNANTLLQAFDQPDYKQTLSEMTLLNDGIGADLAAKILTGIAFPENLNGTDFVPALLDTSSHSMRIYLFGAKPGIAAQAAKNFSASYPRHTIVGVRDGYFQDTDLKEIFDDISTAKPDLLLVAMGNPRQENFIMQHRDKLNVPVAMGVGALLDFTANIVPRAPMWMRKTKTEWLFRLSQEPLRLLHRYTIGIGRFLIVVLRLRFSAKSS